MVALLCDCEKHKKYEEHMEQHKLVQFLMGLNETYAQARSQVLLIVPVPTLNQAYNMIMQDESQRTQSSMISQLSTGLQQMNMIDPTAFAFTQNNKSKKNNGMYCNYCHLKVHLKENCYSWLDIPQVISLIEERALTDQYQQLLKLINQEPTVAESRANMVGIKELLTTCLLAGSEPDSLVIDTGASNHMDLFTGKAGVIGKEKGGLYILQPTKKSLPVKGPWQSSFSVLSTPNPIISSTPALHTSVSDLSHSSSLESSHYNICHQRLGHDSHTKNTFLEESIVE
uniref:Uncharacterized protein n=1 Tax=Nicotiana tabacum TaxID=4097 RepID=A0A1S3ZH30_TOBAC|nr:PREDICTED: uncharacterized protein LOC107786758 [Nicotiana tabacum]